MRKRWLILVIFSALILSSLGAVAQAGTSGATGGDVFLDQLSSFSTQSPLGIPGSIRGYVFLDRNQNGVFDVGQEEGLPLVDITVSYGEYQHTYCTGGGDPNGEVPGPGSYGPTALQGGYWTVTLHVPDGYRATTPTEQGALVPAEGGAVTGVNFGLYGSGSIASSVCPPELGVVQDTGAPGLAIGGGAGAGLPQTGGVAQPQRGHLIALLAAVVGFLALLGTPWCVTQARRVHRRWW
jgi:hypothetical protein